ncbi:MAG: pyruvate decarboxylase [Chryseobacterium sp.]|nr:pyruvate decarboxylase [Chryseobacterium sp.]
MKKVLYFGIVITASACIIICCASAGNRVDYINRQVKIGKIQRIIIYEPEVFPDVEEIKEPTNTAYFSALSDELNNLGDYKLLRINSTATYNFTEIPILKELCKNNSADAILIPKVKYFKVGIGKYVFSNQVIVSLKLYDSAGNFIIETSYDTFKTNGRMLGSAENSIKIGTVGALRKMSEEIRSNKLMERKL